MVNILAKVFNFTKQDKSQEMVNAEFLEIYINADGTLMLYPALLLIRDVAEEVGELEFDFTPYCC